MKVNMGKGQLAATTEAGRSILRRAQIGKVVASARDLGSEFSITARRATVQQQRVAEATRRAHRISRLPLPRISRELFVRSTVLPVAL